MTAGQGAGPLRVAQLIETLGVGGAETLAVRIANAVAAAGHDSHLVVMGEPGPLSGRIDAAVKVHYLGFERASVKSPFAFAGSLRKGSRLLRKVIYTNRFQVIQSHLPGANFWGLLVAIRGFCPVLATIHNNQEFRYGDHDNAVRAAFRKQAYRMILRRCAGTVAVSRAVKESLVRDLGPGRAAGDRIAVVTNGVEIPVAQTAEAGEAIRTGLGVPVASPLILAAGRFGEQKNFGDLVAAAAILVARGYRFRLVIAGDGPDRDGLSARVGELGLEETVLLPGNLANLGDVMQAADIFTMSSLWEGLPLVLLEAMAAGLPAAAYRIPGVEELVVEGETGLMVPVADVAALADAWAGLLDDPVRARSMGQRGRSLVAERFDFSRLVDSLLALYRRVAQPDLSRA